MIRNISVLLGTAGIIAFILPVFTGRIINIGNITGLAVSLAILLYGILQRSIHAVIAQMWKSGGLCRGALVLAGAVICAVALTALVLTCMIIRAALTRPDPSANVIVLGCEVKGDQPSRMLTARLETAIAWLQDHPHVYCVVSGGKGEKEKISEAECMYRYMTARGIAPERIIREDRSVSTRENLSFSLQKLQEAGLLPASGSMEGAQIAVVTNEFHACRALCIAGDLGIRAGSVPASSPWWLLPTFYVRELYGLLYQIFL